MVDTVSLQSDRWVVRFWLSYPDGRTGYREVRCPHYTDMQRLIRVINKMLTEGKMTASIGELDYGAPIYFERT